MSDPVRKDLHDKVQEKVMPDAMKSDTQRLKEAATDTGDRVAREFQGDSTKSTVQESADKAERAKDNVVHGSTHQTVGDKIKDALNFGKHDKPGDHHTGGSI